MAPNTRRQVETELTGMRVEADGCRNDDLVGDIGAKEITCVRVELVPPIQPAVVQLLKAFPCRTLNCIFTRVERCEPNRKTGTGHVHV